MSGFATPNLPLSASSSGIVPCCPGAALSVRDLVAKVAAIGAVKRKGLSGLKAYGGTIEGKGEVRHKDGGKTKFTIRGDKAAKP